MKNQDEHQIGWLTLSTIWFGGMVSVPALVIGSALISALPFVEMCVASAIGFSILAVLMCFQSVAAVETRKNTVELASAAFGRTGANGVIGATVGISLVGWFGVQTQIASDSFVRVAQQSFQLRVDQGLMAQILGLLMVTVAVLGFKSMRWLNCIAVPCKIALVCYAVYIAAQASSFEAVLAYRPAPEARLDILTAVGLSIGAFAVAAVIAPDYARHCRSRSAAVVGTVLGILPAAMGMAVCGAVLSIFMHTYDIVEIYAHTGMPVLALCILIAAAWTTNVMNAYSAGLALNQLFHFPASWRPWTTMAAGLCGASLAALGIMTNFISFLTVLTVTVPPIAGVLVAAYWLVPRDAGREPRNIDWRGIAAWVAGSALTLVIPHPVHNLVGVASGALVFAVLVRLSDD
jgi:cytosine permease